MPLISLGPIVFLSGSVGWSPQTIAGPSQNAYVVEHRIPGRVGGVTELLGSEQRTLSLRGFLAIPTGITSGGDAVFTILSGASFLSSPADRAKEELMGLQGSGAQLLRIESTNSPVDQVGRTWYENDFYMITNINFGYEQGRAYPYYPYTINLRKHLFSQYGNSSGVTNLGPSAFGGSVFLSGYIRTYQLVSGAPRGELINHLGVYCVDALASSGAVTGNNMKLAIYSNVLSVPTTLLAQTAIQTMHSGWNYFPLNPGLSSVSGTTYHLAIAGDARNSNDYRLQYTDQGAGNIDESYLSGYIINNSFPSPLAPGTGAAVSGKNFKVVMIAAT